MNVKQAFKLIRPQQWVKQIIVFIPILSLGEAFRFTELILGIAAMASFTLAAGLVYILNDVVDAESDRLNELRKTRPIASRTLEKKHILIIAVGLATGLITSVSMFSKNVTASLGLIFIYFVVNSLYSLGKLKEHNIIGVALVAVGFPIRFAYGCFFMGISISFWGLVLLMQLALFMLSVKRYKRVVQEITPPADLINQFWLLSAVIFAATFSSSYMGFVTSPSSQIVWGINALLISCIPISLAIVRFIELATRKENLGNGDLTESLHKDWLFVSLVFTYCIVMLAGSLSQ